MANRLNAPNQFEALAPPWLLVSLDTNFTQNQAAWNDSSLGFVNGVCTDTGSANVYVVTSGNLPFGAPSAYNPGMTIAFIPATTNTGASTMQVGLLGSVAILTPAGNALQGGEIVDNAICFLAYSSSAPVGFRIVGTCPLSLQTTTSSTTLSVECAGYTSVALVVTFTGAGIAVTLSHLAQGVPVFLEVANASGGLHGVSILATSPSGAAFTVVNAFASGTANGHSGVDMIVTGINITNGLALVFTGAASAPLQIVLAY